MEERIKSRRPRQEVGERRQLKKAADMVLST
jgi:hypothetical protein